MRTGLINDGPDNWRKEIGHMKRNIKSDSDRKGFTLIELLVVVSIIALLVSILMPALGKARRQTRRVVCTARMTQYALATNLYVQDNGGYVPALLSTAYPWVAWPMGFKGGDGKPQGHALLLKYLGLDRYPLAKLREPLPPYYWSGADHYHLQGFDIFACPAANEDVIEACDGPSFNVVWTHYVQYCGTTSSAYPGSNTLLVKMKPSSVLYCDLIWWGGSNEPSDTSGFHRNENGLVEGGNAAFTDGSADWRKADEDMSVNFNHIQPAEFGYWIPKFNR
jgi:prepilin-type N-terminal cleavage/methylation domain-containing protein